MHHYSGTYNRVPQWTFMDPLKPVVRPGVRKVSVSVFPALLATPAIITHNKSEHCLLTSSKHLRRGLYTYVVPSIWLLSFDLVNMIETRPLHISFCANTHSAHSQCKLLLVLPNFVLGEKLGFVINLWKKKKTFLVRRNNCRTILISLVPSVDKFIYLYTHTHWFRFGLLTNFVDFYVCKGCG